MSKYQIDQNGYYGEFGGAYIPEILRKNVVELKENYLQIIENEQFKKDFQKLLKDYVGRPTPLYFAKRLSEKYGTNIFLKREDLCHTGAHKLNNALGQILLARKLGKTRIVAETGAGQHGVATATVCALMNMECVVYMGETDVKRQFLNVQRMRMLGAKVVPVMSGNRTLKDGTNEAIRDWCCNPKNTHYIIGSVVGPDPYPDMVARFQSVISEEIKYQLQEQTGRNYPDKLLACIGGGSNAAGTFYHYIDDERVKFFAAEAAGLGLDDPEKSAATIHLGKKGVLHGSLSLVMMTDDGQIVEPYSISAGLDYPGVGPMHAFFAKCGRTKVLAVTDAEAMQAAMELTKLEGIIPAIESAHALAMLPKINFVKDENVVITVSGRGDKDMNTYVKYFNMEE
ncbi:MAG: tryptophan synthase subunit beta [Bacteroidales bacterium]|nr:tryptophan synthase subunit beta [Bacteroidales bacterium]